jgi:hypothetical protein
MKPRMHESMHEPINQQVRCVVGPHSRKAAIILCTCPIALASHNPDLPKEQLERKRKTKRDREREKERETER